MSQQFLVGKAPGARHCGIGQEAAIIVACAVLRDEYVTSTHRSDGHPIGKGAQLDGLMAEDVTALVTGHSDENSARRKAGSRDARGDCGGRGARLSFVRASR